jgi:hypothetical protein
MRTNLGLFVEGGKLLFFDFTLAHFKLFSSHCVTAASLTKLHQLTSQIFILDGKDGRTNRT